MTHTTQALIGTVVDIAGVALLASIGVVTAITAIGRMLRRATRPRGPHTHVPGVMVIGYRMCPEELRTRAAVIHADGTAHCADCDAHIPAPEVTR
jgi:hypothetical protein